MKTSEFIESCVTFVEEELNWAHKWSTNRSHNRNRILQGLCPPLTSERHRGTRDLFLFDILDLPTHKWAGWLRYNLRVPSGSIFLDSFKSSHNRIQFKCTLPITHKRDVTFLCHTGFECFPGLCMLKTAQMFIVPNPLSHGSMHSFCLLGKMLSDY